MSEELESQERTEKIVKIISKMKGKDILILDLREKNAIADFFVIASGTSSRHVEAMGEEVKVRMKEQGNKLRGSEGQGDGTWVLLDYNDVIVHLFHHESREFYNLEKLWIDAKITEVK